MKPSKDGSTVPVVKEEKTENRVEKVVVEKPFQRGVYHSSGQSRRKGESCGEKVEKPSKDGSTVPVVKEETCSM